MKTKNILLIFAILIAIILAITYPKFNIITDEVSYLLQADLFNKGQIYTTEHSESYGLQKYGNRYFSKHSPGMALLLTPFLMLGWQYTFILNMGLLLIGFVVFIKILKKLNINAVYSLLYLLHPSIIFYSRTIMSEIASITAFLIAFYLYMDKKTKYHILSGLFFGIVTLTRYPSVIFFIPFLIASLKNQKKLFSLILGFSPAIFFILNYNIASLGTIFQTTYYVTAGTTANLNGAINVIRTYFNYVISLLILYPLMIMSPIFYKGKYKFEIILTTLLSIGIFGFGNTEIFRYGTIQNSIISIRYILPIIPLLIITYSEFIDNMLKKLNMNRLFIPFCIILLIGSIFIINEQNKIGNSSFEIMSEIYKNIPEDSLIAGDAFSMRFITPSFGPQKGMKINNEDFKEESKKHQTYIVAVIQEHWKKICEKSSKDSKECELGELYELDDEIKNNLIMIKSVDINRDTLKIYKLTS